MVNMDAKLKENTSAFREGQRVLDGEGYRATIRYIGPVCTAKDTEAMWIGKNEEYLKLNSFSFLLL